MKTSVFHWLLPMMGVYFIAVMILARVFSRKILNLKDFFLAGRSLSAWPVAIAFVSSWFGAGSTMGSINAFHHDGLSGLWYIFIPSGLSCLIITLFLSRRVARQKEMSQPEAVQNHYGRWGRLLLSMIILISIVNFVASQMVAAGQIFHSVLGIDILPATVLCTAVVLGYSMMGGYFAVVITDFAQISMVIIGLLLLLLCSFLNFSGISALSAYLAQRPEGFWTLAGTGQTPVLEYVCLSITFVLAWCIAPEMWQRMTSTRHEQVAATAGKLAAVILLGLYLVVLAIGLLSSYDIGGQSQQVMVDLALSLPHPFLGALVLLGFIAAVTSTMDSSMNIGSLTLTRDLYQGFLRPGATESELLWVSRLALLLVAVPAILIAVAFQDIIHVLWMSADVFASAMFVPIIGILFISRPRRLSGVLAMMLGLASAIISMALQYDWLQLAASLPFAWPKAPYSTLMGVGFSLLGFAVGYLLPEPKHASPQAHALS